MQFAVAFPDEEIVSALRRQLSWTHIRMIIYMDDPLKRAFYVELCRLERWSSRQLQERIQSMLYERTATTWQAHQQFPLGASYRVKLFSVSGPEGPAPPGDA